MQVNTATAKERTEPANNDTEANVNADGRFGPIGGVTTLLQLDILFTLAPADTVTGTTLRERLTDGGVPINNNSSIYQNLDRLVERGLVEKTEDGRSNGYSLTDDGLLAVEAYYEWCGSRMRPFPSGGVGA